MNMFEIGKSVRVVKDYDDLNGEFDNLIGVVVNIRPNVPYPIYVDFREQDILNLPFSLDELEVVD